ncbi:DUF305 domain-containing protein [Trinickia terrae]|uniref:DUF305 domain-containing protein n=1 Tax=Trinickia terrae TaxID=2571161 RepID=A0A4U1IEU0_9BURK|nr:DUF305 domain-containing protein [Trinickia terrae]
MKKAKLVSLLFSCALTGATFASAARADGMQDISGMQMGSTLTNKDASTHAYKDADATMMREMDAPPYTGNADRDFVAHMIPHHQGAIDMAEVELKYGKDPAIRKLAADIVKAQRGEIAFMKRWQATHGSM